MNLADRFWSKVKRGAPDDCWPWLGRTDKGGYGTFKVEGQSRQAHRVARELTFGPIPGRLCALHTCDNRPCCNPDHTFEGTRADNIRDMIAKGRDRKVRGADHWARKRPPRGELNSRAKLTEADVLAIRTRALTEMTSALAREFGMSEGALRHIIKRRNWKHVA